MSNGSRSLLIVLGVLVLLVLLMPLLGGGMMGTGMMWGPGGMWTPSSGGGWAWGLAMGLGGLAMLAFWGAVIVGVVLLFRSISSAGDGRGATRESALDILKRRYAAGEITHEEFQQMRKALER